MIGLPVLIVCCWAYLPRLAGVQGAPAWILRVSMAVVFVALVPAAIWRQIPSNVRSVAAAREHYWLWRPGAADFRGPTEEGVVFARVRDELIDESHCCSAVETSMRSMAELMAELKSITGDRRTYVEHVNGLLPGHVYFFADLVPAPIYAERADMVVNSIVFEKFLKYFRNDVAGIECIISDNTAFPELDLFKEAHPKYQVIEKEFEGRPLYIYLAEKD
jgi:hypothetical protein